MTNPKLNDHLLEDVDDLEAGIELPTVMSAEESDEIERTIKKFRLNYPAETQAEKSRRLSKEERADKTVLVAFAVLAAISVLSCTLSMCFYWSNIIVMLFCLSVVQGPLVLCQRIELEKSKVLREAIATLWTQRKSLKIESDGLPIDITAMRKDIVRRRSAVRKYKKFMEGYEFSEIVDLYEENERIKTQTKQLAESIGLLKLEKSILMTDPDPGHFLGENELSLLAHRVVLNEGVPFTSEELCQRFRLGGALTLRNLADVVCALYLEKRREQIAFKEAEIISRSPRNLGAPELWKRKIDGIGIVV